MGETGAERMDEVSRFRHVGWAPIDYRWFVDSPAAGRINSALLVALSLVTTVTSASLLVSTATRTPLAVPLASFAAMTLVIVPAQLWVILWLNSQRAHLAPEERSSFWTQVAGPLPPWIALPIGVVGILGWIALMHGILSLSDGGPTSPQPGCDTPLSNHGSVHCVSPAEFVAAQVAEQHTLAGGMLCFAAMQLLVTLSLRATRRRESATWLPASY